MKENTKTILPQYSFKHKWQLYQLKRLDFSAYAKIILLLKHSLFSMAEKTTKIAMQNISTQLSSPPTFQHITQIIKDKQQWYSGEVLNLWQSGSLSVHIRNESGRLNALFVHEGKRLMERETVSLQIGYLDPQQGRWKIIPIVQDDYNKIITKGEL